MFTPLGAQQESVPVLSRFAPPRLHTLLGAVLVVAMALPLFPELVRDWLSNDDYSHGFLIPIVAVWLLWRRRDGWRWDVVSPSWVGPVIVLVGTVLNLLGVVAIEQFTRRVSILIVLIGLVLSLWGRSGLRVWWFPTAYLLLMIPLPGVLHNTLSFPLRVLATRTSESILTLVGIPVLRDGNILHLPGGSLEVVDACSGIRSLISLAAVSCAVAYSSIATWGRRLTLITSTMPVAFVANILRLTASGLFLAWLGPWTIEGVFHTALGISVFVVGLLTIWCLGRLLWRREAC